MMMMMMMMMMIQIDSYSVFYDNGHVTRTELHDLLTARDITTLYIVGLATDYCVYYTAIDAISLGLPSSQWRHWGGGGPPRVTPSWGDTRRKKIAGQFTKNGGETRSDR